MAIKHVNSSTIRHLDYDEKTKTLSVTFLSGATYHYDGVSPEAYKALETADSVGGHLARHIKGKYPHRKATS